MLSTFLILVVMQPREAQPIEKTAPIQQRIGAIHIQGNIVTKDGPIRDLLGLFPGQILASEDDFRWAEIRLLVAFQKRFDLINHVRPRVVVRPDQNGSGFRDVWVLFPERPGMMDDGKPSARPLLEIDPRLDAADKTQRGPAATGRSKAIRKFRRVENEASSDL
jgi:hypothetical protein